MTDESTVPVLKLVAPQLFVPDVVAAAEGLTVSSGHDAAIFKLTENEELKNTAARVYEKHRLLQNR